MDPGSGTGIDAFDYDGGLVTLLVGPEGGLDDEEMKDAYAAGFRGITLGPRTLRTETAAVVGVTAIQLRWGDLDSGE
jgi:16S rRNA (uracil1498-N3)-methyltransferase